MLVMYPYSPIIYVPINTKADMCLSHIILNFLTEIQLPCMKGCKHYLNKQCAINLHQLTMQQ